MGRAKTLIMRRKKSASISEMDSKFPYAQKMIVALDKGIGTDPKLKILLVVK